MIDSVKGSEYSRYLINDYLMDQTKHPVEKNQVEDVREWIKNIEGYTYTKEDVKAVDQEMARQIKEQLDIRQEDVYELYARGVDLEALSMNELCYLSSKQQEEKQVYSLSDAELENQEVALEEKLSVISKKKDSMYLYALTSKEPVTVNSLYESTFKGAFKKSITEYTKQDVENVLAMNGLAATSGNMWAGDLLMMYDMGVDAASVNKLQNIQSAVCALEFQQTGELSAADDLIKEDEVIYRNEEVDRITDDLGMVTDEHIESLIEEACEMNIKELRESIHKNVERSLKGAKQQSSDHVIELSKVEEIIVGESGLVEYDSVEQIQKQIQEIRTRLTVEAAQKISGKMPLESSKLSEVVEALRQLEQEKVVAALEEVDLPTTQANQESIVAMMDAVVAIKSHFVESVQIEWETDEKASLQEMHQALGAYEVNETLAEKRFGETFSKVSSQVEGLLQAQSLEVNSRTLESAKALITNGLEVTAEHVANIEEIVIKLDNFLEEMTPTQVAHLLKEGIDPYQSTVNELLNYMSDKKLVGLKNSVAESIMWMEQKGEISESQKQGMIGIYRTLQSVTTQKEAVMGYLYKNQLPLTLESLQQASRYVNQTEHINTVVDDQLGEIKELVYSRETAKQLVEQSVEVANRTRQVLQELEEMSLPITEENLHKMSKLTAFLYPYIKEQFKREFSSFEGMSTLPDSFKEKLEYAQQASPEMLKEMIAKNIPLTLTNIYCAGHLEDNPSLYSELLREQSLLNEALPESLETFREVLEEVASHTDKAREEAVLKGDAKTYKEAKQLSEIVTYQKVRIEKEGLYQIPFMIDGEHRMVQLYLHKEEHVQVPEEERPLKAIITYQTKNLGEVKAYVEIRGEQIGYRLEAQSGVGSVALEKQGEQLVKRLDQIGYRVGYREVMREKGQDEITWPVVHKYNEGQFEEMI